MAGLAGLDQHASTALTATRPPRNLDNQLGEVFGAPEVAAEQAAVGIEDADQGDAGKIVPLGQHLGADEDAGLAPADRFEEFVQPPATPRAVTVDADDGGIREALREQAFGLFSALANRVQTLLAAFRAYPGDSLLVAAVVAAQAVVVAVIGQPGIAVRAFNGGAALEAHDDRREAPAVDEQQHLVAGFQGPVDGVQQRW